MIKRPPVLVYTCMQYHCIKHKGSRGFSHTAIAPSIQLQYCQSPLAKPASWQNGQRRVQVPFIPQVEKVTLWGLDVDLGVPAPQSQLEPGQT